MKNKVGILSLIFLSGCANFDSEAFQRGLAQAYVYNQAVTQPRVDALNAQSVAMAQRNSAALVPTPVADFEWDWDQFYDADRRLVWACRGVQTGQLAEPARCAYKPQTDLRWPEK